MEVNISDMEIANLCLSAFKGITAIGKLQMNDRFWRVNYQVLCVGVLLS